MISFNVCSSVVLDSGKNTLLARSASGSYFVVTETYCLNPYQIAVVDHLRRTTTTSFAHNSHTKNLPFQIPTSLSTVHRHIFIFWKQRLYIWRWCGKNTRLILHRWGELMVFIQFIFFTLCTLIHKDANIQLVLYFTLHWFSRGNIYHAPSHSHLPKREITFRVCIVEL